MKKALGLSLLLAIFLYCYFGTTVLAANTSNESYCLHNNTKQLHYEPTCTKEGYDCIQCSDCGSIIQKTNLYKALGHSFVQNNCSRCGLKEFKYISFEDAEGVYISKYNGNNTTIKIPSMIDGYHVVGIEWFAFENNKNITSVSIPQNIKFISVGAFDNCSNLKSIALVDGLEIIGEMAFRHCIKLTSITVPDSVTHIGNYAFGGCLNLTSINVEENNPNYCSVDGVLFNKDKTILIQYPANKNSKSYVIPDSVTSIADYAFEGCTNLTSVILPESVTNIGVYSFSGCTNLASIVIPNSVTNIGYDAFCNCTSLTSITIPDSVTKIGVYAFSDCSKLTSIDVDKNNPSYCSIDGVLFNKDKTILIQYPANKNSKSYIIPDSVTSIADYAFEGCTNLTSVIIPDSVTRIDNYAFKECTNLTSVVIPKSMLSIGDFSFENCYNLQTIYYIGNEKMWNNLSVNDEFNKNLLSANIVYNYKQTLATPKVSSTSTISGIQLNWNKTPGAMKYNIYRRNAGQSSYTYIGTTSGNTFIDKNVKSGQYYCYSVRAFNSTGSYSNYVKANTSTRKYMATPKLTTIYNHQNGLAIKWNAISGTTTGYRVYRRGAGQTTWTYLGTTKNTYYIDSAVKNKNGEYYRYTVIADGGYRSAFDTNGLYLRRLANPTLNSAVSSKSGITVTWDKVAGSSGYYVYRKTENSTWTRIAVVKGVNNLGYLDKTAKKGTTYTYTVRAVYGNTLSSYYSGISCKDKY